MARKSIVGQSVVAEPAVRETAVCFPDSDGEPMAENNLQQRAICYATGALRAHFRDRSDVHVRGDMFIYYRNGDPQKSIVPDVFVVFGDVEVPQTSYKVWEVGVVPQFVMEVASESTHLLDQDRKVGKYARLGVREYWRFDPTGELFRPPEYGVCVLGQRLAAGGRYEPLEPQPGGAVRSEVLGLDVCEVAGRLRFWDYRDQRLLGSHTEECRARELAERARDEAKGAREETERARDEAQREWVEAERARDEAKRAKAETEAEIGRLGAMLAARRSATGQGGRDR